jgi:GntR family transcriptional regulator, transcriptional repressor for pyruvate dehydrogenase complex
MEAGFEPIGPRRAFEGAVEQIAQRIRHGDLGEGDRLPSERVLAEAMRISRPTLREAVKVLAKAGVLEVHPGATGGIFVASGYVPIELLRLQSDVRLAEVAGVLEARRLLEPQVAHFAAQNASEADFERMQLTIEAHKQMLRSGEVLEEEDRFLQLDMQFHVRMAEATGNTTVVGLMRSLLRRLEIGRDLALRQPPIPEWVVDIHERTLAALRTGDHAQITAVMDEHLGGMERAWEQETGRRLRLLA